MLKPGLTSGLHPWYSQKNTFPILKYLIKRMGFLKFSRH